MLRTLMCVVAAVMLLGTDARNSVSASKDHPHFRILEMHEKAFDAASKRGWQSDLQSTGNALRLGQDYMIREDYPKAMKIFQEVLGSTSDRRMKAWALLGLGWANARLQQHEKGYGYFQKALNIANEIGDEQAKGIILGGLGWYHYYARNDYSKALEIFEESLKINRRVGNVKHQIVSLNGFGWANAKLSQYSKALEFFQQALKLSGNFEAWHEWLSLEGMGWVYTRLGQYQKALEVQHNIMTVLDKRKLPEYSKGVCLNHMGSAYMELGYYDKALEVFEKAVVVHRKVGLHEREAYALNGIGTVHQALGDYHKALLFCMSSLDLSSKAGEPMVESNALRNVASIYCRAGEYEKALPYYEKSVGITERIGFVHGTAATLNELGATYAELANYDKALASFERSLEIAQKIGSPADRSKDLIGNLYLDTGELDKAEPYIKEAGYKSSLGRLSLLKSDYTSARVFYAELLDSAQKSHNVDDLFTAHTGLGKVSEALEDYNQAEQHYAAGMKLTEEIRSSLLPSERRNFFEVRIKGFCRSEPAKGLTRVRMKLNRWGDSIDSSEGVRARAFSDNLCQRSAAGNYGIPSDILNKEEQEVTKLASLKKAINETSEDKDPERYANLTKEIQKAEEDLKAFVEMLWEKHRAYASVKYPRPVSLKEAEIRPDEYIVIFDVLDEGVAAKLIKGKAVAQASYVKLDSRELAKEVNRFRQPLEALKLREFDPELGVTLYKTLLAPVVKDIPKGVPITIIPDGILAVLPFEALVTSGKATWKKNEWGDYPEGLTYLGDVHPISYRQSLTAITLARTLGDKRQPGDRLLVMADPVFQLKDERAQSAQELKMAGKDQEYYLNLMATVEETSGGSFRFKRLPETAALADNLAKLYGADCDIFTNFKASKNEFLNLAAAGLGRYGWMVFATHGLFSNKIPGIVEPFLVLTMVPPGTDGFFKMSEVMGLKLNADLVALTACQTGLGKELSGEGIMSMGRAFQYAGARSVLMSLWSVADKSSVKLVGNFFRNVKDGKKKLQALQLAREEIRKQGFEHPFFWAPFILVGETD